MLGPFSGGCACCAIRYTCSAEPRYMGNCHCRDCQRATGSAYFAAVLVKETDFSLTSGEPAWYKKRRIEEIPCAARFVPAVAHPSG